MAGKTAQGNRAYEEMESKRVSLIELFYDLVFVYMISRATELLHHLHNGMISPTALIIFIFVVIVFINSWMVQTVFTNRYGESSWTNILFSFVDMAIILYMSNTFSATIDYNLQSFFIAASLLSVTLALQYALVYIKTDNQDDKDIARIFFHYPRHQGFVIARRRIPPPAGWGASCCSGDTAQLDSTGIHREIHQQASCYFLPSSGTSDTSDHYYFWGNDRRDRGLFHAQYAVMGIGLYFCYSCQPVPHLHYPVRSRY